MPGKNLSRHIPNLFTFANLFIGCLGIAFCFNETAFAIPVGDSANSGMPVSAIFGFNSQLYLACFMIYIASILDFADGFAARALHAHSAIGKQLDSLADVVSFGVLPSFVFYQLLSACYQAQPNAFSIPVLYLLPAFVLAIAAAWRLAKFNLDDKQEKTFSGLPTPPAAIFTASLPLIVLTNAFGLGSLLLNNWILYVLVALLSLLMISKIKMFALKINSFSLKGNEWKIIFAAVCVVIIVLMKYTGIALSVILYVLLCLAQNIFRKENSADIPT